MTDTTDPTKPVAWRVTRYDKNGEWLDTTACLYKPTLEPRDRLDIEPLVRLSEYERVKAERDEARKIVRDIYWMALRYADGRKSYAVGMVNDAVRKGYDAGWLVHSHEKDPAFARDGMGPEYRSVEARSEALEAEVKRLREAFHSAMAGVNHLASQLISRLGADFAEQYPFDMDVGTALRRLHATVEFDMWCAWASAMKARAALEASR